MPGAWQSELPGNERLMGGWGAGGQAKQKRSAPAEAEGDDDEVLREANAPRSEPGLAKKQKKRRLRRAGEAVE